MLDIGNLVQTALGAMVSWIVDGAVAAWKTAAAWALGAGGMGDGEWTVAGDLLNKVAGVMAVLAVAAGAIGIVRGMVDGRIGDVTAAFAFTLMAWPLTVILVDVASALMGVLDGLTDKVLGLDPDAIGRFGELDGDALTTWCGQTAAVIVAIVLLVSVFVLCTMMAARTILLIIGFGLAPAAVMLSGWKRMRALMWRWLAWIVGLMLFKPIVAIVFYVCGTLMVSAQAGETSALGYFAAIAGMVIASVAPWKVIHVIGDFLPAGQQVDKAAGTGQAVVHGAKEAAKTAASVAVTVATGGASAGAMGASGAAGAAGAKAGGAPQGASAAGGAQKAGASPAGGGKGTSGTGMDAARPSGQPTSPTGGEPEASGSSQDGGTGKSLHDRASALAEATSAAAGRRTVMPLHGAALTAAQFLHGGATAIASLTGRKDGGMAAGPNATAVAASPSRDGAPGRDGVGGKGGQGGLGGSGTRGADGKDGTPGAQGAKGDKGDQGDKGESGDDPIRTHRSR